MAFAPAPVARQVADKSAFFLTRRESYRPAEELTVVYGGSYNRTYSTWGHQGNPPIYKVPPDLFADGTWASHAGGACAPWASWPVRTPGWFNVERQPTNRPAFQRREDGSVELLPDLPLVVKV